MPSVSPVSTSAISKVNVFELSSSMVLSSTSVIVGASLIGTTVSSKSVESVNSPSDTITVIVDFPCQFNIGATLIDLFSDSESTVTSTPLVSDKTDRTNVSPVSISATSNK